MTLSKVSGVALAVAMAGWCDTPATAKEPLPTFASGAVALTGDGEVHLDTTYARGGPANAIMLSGAGPLVSYCPQLACVVEPRPDHQRAAALFAATTKDDGHSEEQTVAIETTVKTGFARHWSPTTSFTAGDNITFSDARNAVYRAVVSGISASSGAGPSGKGESIVDGTVRWEWINDSAIDAKVGLYNEVATVRGGGGSWGQANNVHLQPGATPSFNINTELDFANDAADCVFGAANCINLLVSSGGAHQSTTGLYVLSDNTKNFALHWGIRVAGDYLASDQDIEDDAAAPVGIGLGLFGGKAHSRAGIQDGSTGAVSFLITGNHSVASIEDTSTSPASLSVGGKHDIAGIIEQSTSQNGLALNGHYAGAQIVGKGFKVDPRGNVESLSVRVADKMIVPVATPTSSSAPCERGQIEFDKAFIYICIATNVWRRSATTPF